MVGRSAVRAGNLSLTLRGGAADDPAVAVNAAVTARDAAILTVHVGLDLDNDFMHGCELSGLLGQFLEVAVSRDLLCRGSAPCDDRWR